MQSNSPNRRALRLIGKAAGAVAATGAAAAAGLTAWSALCVNHRQPLPPALNARRYTSATPLAGCLAFYADDAAPGRPLLLLHSINAAASSYEVRPIFDHFRGKRPVFALDLPGFGFSERSRREYSPEIFVQAILDFIVGELQSTEAVDVVALSLSSEFTAIAAVEQPGAFGSLCFIAPTGFGSETAHRSDSLYRAVSFPLWAQAFYDLLVTQASIRYFLRKVFAGPVDPGLERYDYLTSHQPGARYAPSQFVSGRLFTPEILDYYAALSQPVLAFCNQSDFGLSIQLPAFCRGRSNWRMRCVEGTKAMPHFERQEETLAILEGFIEAESYNQSLR